MTKGSRGRKGKEIHLYIPEAMLLEVQAECRRLERNTSWVLARAWKIAKKHGMGGA